MLFSGVSQRRIAMILKVSRLTVVRKFIFLANLCREQNLQDFLNHPQFSQIQFDDLETIEHTKCKPLSVTLAVEKHSRFILGFEVSRMPAKGHLASIALKKYGPRADKRQKAREKLFRHLSQNIDPRAQFESDQNPHYTPVVKKYFPLSTHSTTKGQRGCVSGQGELKKIGFDPLFTLNHTFAMLRANINRLFRKTWCTTKDPERLRDHIEIYVHFHNRCVI